MRTFFLGIIAACLFAQTFGIYRADNGGINVFFGGFGYHIAESE